MSETKWQRARQLLARTHGLLSSGYGIDPLMKAQLLDDLEAWNSQDTADAPEPSADDVRVEAIRERIGDAPEPDTSETTRELIAKLREMVGVIDAQIADNPPQRYRKQLERKRADAVRSLESFTYDEYADERYLLERLDAMTKERNELRARLNADTKESDDGDAG